MKQNTEDRILEILRQAPGNELDRKVIQKAAGVAARTMDNALTLLRESGRIERRYEQKGMARCAIYKLTTEGEASR